MIVRVLTQDVYPHVYDVSGYSVIELSGELTGYALLSVVLFVGSPSESFELPANWCAS